MSCMKCLHAQAVSHTQLGASTHGCPCVPLYPFLSSHSHCSPQARQMCSSHIFKPLAPAPFASGGDFWLAHAAFAGFICLFVCRACCLCAVCLLSFSLPAFSPWAGLLHSWMASHSLASCRSCLALLANPQHNQDHF